MPSLSASNTKEQTEAPTTCTAHIIRLARDDLQLPERVVGELQLRTSVSTAVHTCEGEPRLPIATTPANRKDGLYPDTGAKPAPRPALVELRRSQSETTTMARNQCPRARSHGAKAKPEVEDVVPPPDTTSVPIATR